MWGDIFYCLCIVVVLSAIYIILKPVHPTLAILAAFCRLMYGMTWLLVIINLFTALRIVTDANYAAFFGQFPDVLKLYLTGYNHYYVGLFFWSVASTIGSYFWYKSNYISKWLAVFGLISSLWCIACTLALYIIPGFDEMLNVWAYDSPMTIFELVLNFVLLFKGLKSPVSKIV